MTDFIQLEMDRGVKQEWNPQTATKKQRDAFYYGHVAGLEITKKLSGQTLNTVFFGNLTHTDPYMLQLQLNRLFTESGFTAKERDSFQQGIMSGVEFSNAETKEKALTYT